MITSNTALVAWHLARYCAELGQTILLGSHYRESAVWGTSLDPITMFKQLLEEIPWASMHNFHRTINGRLWRSPVAAWRSISGSTVWPVWVMCVPPGRQLHSRKASSRATAHLSCWRAVTKVICQVNLDLYAHQPRPSLSLAMDSSCIKLLGFFSPVCGERDRVCPLYFWAAGFSAALVCVAASWNAGRI